MIAAGYRSAELNRAKSARRADVARYLVGDGHEVICEMEHFPKHWIASLAFATELQSPLRSARGGAPISPIAVRYRHAGPLNRAVS